MSTRRWRRRAYRRLRRARTPKKETKEESRNDINIYYTKIHIYIYIFRCSARKEVRKVICESPPRPCRYKRLQWVWAVDRLASFDPCASSCNFLNFSFFLVRPVKLNGVVVEWTFVGRRRAPHSTFMAFFFVSILFSQPLKTKTPSICCC